MIAIKKDVVQAAGALQFVQLQEAAVNTRSDEFTSVV